MAITKIYGMNWLKCMHVDCSKQYNNVYGSEGFLISHFNILYGDYQDIDDGVRQWGSQVVAVQG